MQKSPIAGADLFSAHLPLLDTALVEQAFDLASPLIEAALAQPSVSGEHVLHMVVVGAAHVFDDAVLAERSFGQQLSDATDYRALARAKARLAWRTSLVDTRHIQQHAPHLLRAGDTLLWGSACRDGLVVAASGAQPWFDEAFSGVVLELVRALSQARRRVLRAHE